MFSVLTGYGADAEGRHSLELSRVNQYTDTAISGQFDVTTQQGILNLALLPCVALPESGPFDETPARIGNVSDLRVVGNELSFRFSVDKTLPSYPKEVIFDIFSEDGSWVRNRTQWAVYQKDIFRELLLCSPQKRVSPTAFKLAEFEPKKAGVAVMMPFDSKFDRVYESIRRSCEAVGLECRRADNIWNRDAIIDDIAELIDTSAVIICDCTGKNPNVFYELGIAHTLGRQTILVTGNEADVPFDVRHRRFLPYLSNDQGLQELENALTGRLRTILNDQ